MWIFFSFFLPHNLLDLQQALSLQILVGLLVDHVATRVLVLFLQNKKTQNNTGHVTVVRSFAVVISARVDSPRCPAASARMPSGTSASPTLELQSKQTGKKTKNINIIETLENAAVRIERGERLLRETASSICVTLAKWAVLGIPRQRMP